MEPGESLLKKALLDFTSYLPLIIMTLSLTIAIYFGFQSISEAIRELIKEAGKNAFVVQPVYNPKLKACGCQVSVIRQS